jgi:hypothetical protein
MRRADFVGMRLGDGDLQDAERAGGREGHRSTTPRSLSMEQQVREQAFITALTTEQFVLQAARSANISEMISRGTVYMGTLSGALIAFGFPAQVATRLDPFVAAVLPAVFLLGEFTFLALLRNTMENLVLFRRMQRIRSYYCTLVLWCRYGGGGPSAG